MKIEVTGKLDTGFTIKRVIKESGNQDMERSDISDAIEVSEPIYKESNINNGQQADGYEPSGNAFVSFGRAKDGLQFYGPFASADFAMDFAEAEKVDIWDVWLHQ